MTITADGYSVHCDSEGCNNQSASGFDVNDAWEDAEINGWTRKERHIHKCPNCSKYNLLYRLDHVASYCNVHNMGQYTRTVREAIEKIKELEAKE